VPVGGENTGTGSSDERAELLVNAERELVQDLGDMPSEAESSSTTQRRQQQQRPLRPKPIEPDDVNIFSFLTFHFIRRVLHMRGDYKSRPKIELSDLTPLAPKDRSSYLSTLFRRHWDAESRKLVPSLSLVLARLFWRPFVWAGIVRLLYEISIFVPPLSLYFMI
jgi:hypothetical protein